MFREARGTSDRTLVIALSLGLTFAYTVIRVAFLFRDAFFDELFTLWIAAQPIDVIIASLRLDSGPPLYYVLLHAVTGGAPTLLAARLFSLLAGVLGALALLRLPFDQTTRATAVLLLVALPANAYFATEARAYALAAMAVGIATVLLAQWRNSGERRFVIAAAFALIGAAYSHYYGALAFSFPLLAAVMPGEVASTLMRRFIAALGASVFMVAAFVPGLILASEQPTQAGDWMKVIRAEDVPLSAIRELGFAPRLPLVIANDLPSSLQTVSIITVALIVIGAARSRETWLWGALTLIPVLTATLLVFAGATAYFPLRFESVVTIPFVIWLARSIATFRPLIRRIAVTTLLLIGVTSSVLMLRSFAARGDDPFRNVATAVSRTAPAGSKLIVSGLSFLEIVSQSPAGVQVKALPRAQASHPGWREFATEAQLDAEVSALQPDHGELLWVGEIPSPEASALSRRFYVRPIMARGPVVYARLMPR